MNKEENVISKKYLQLVTRQLTKIRVKNMSNKIKGMFDSKEREKSREASL